MYYQTSIDDYEITQEEYIKIKRENEYLRNLIKQREQLIKSFCKDLTHMNETLRYDHKYRNCKPYQEALYEKL